MRGNIVCLCAALLLFGTAAGARTHTGKLGGTIVATNGRPCVDAQVIVERSDGSHPIAMHTDSHGRFLFKFVLPGLYDVRASNKTAASEWKRNVTVHPGKETIVNLRLEHIRISQKTVTPR